MGTEDDPAGGLAGETFSQRLARASQKRSAASFQSVADALVAESRKNPERNVIEFSEEEIQEIGKVLNIPVTKARDLCS